MEKYIKISEKDFKDKANNLKLIMEYQEKFYENFLKIKLGFLAFLGIMLPIIFNNRHNFSCAFLFVFLTMVFFTFILFILGLWNKLQDVYQSLKKQSRWTHLAKIRHIATLHPELSMYYKDAGSLLINEDKTKQAMSMGKGIEEIIKYKETIWWRVEFLMWALLFLSIPILFLLEVLGIL